MQKEKHKNKNKTKQIYSSATLFTKQQQQQTKRIKNPENVFFLLKKLRSI